MAAYRRALQGEKFTREVHYRDRIFFVYIEPLRNEYGEIIGTLGVAHDVTEQKRAQIVLEHHNKKIALLNSITQHDARNKISALMSYLSLLKERVRDPGSHADIDKIDAIVTDLAEQIEFTREYQNLGFQKPQWQDFTSLIQTLPREQIPINTGIHDLQIFADPMLKKVFCNLLDNAIRHGERVTAITIAEQETDAGLILIWEDNGVGIDAENKDKIFNRGFGKNTGLGLFLIREILSITGITITENGIPGKGARFEIRVPRGSYGYSRAR